MARRKYDEELFRVRTPRGTKLTPSKKVAGAFSPLVHGKGIKAQAVLLPVRSGGRRRSFLSSVLTFVTKSLLAVLAVGALLVVVAVVVSAVADGVGAGLAEVSDALSAAAEYLVIAAAAAAAITVGLGGVKILRFVFHRRALAARRAELRIAAAESRAHFHASGSAQPIHWPESARVQHRGTGVTRPVYARGWYFDPSSAAQLRYWDGSAWTPHVRPRQSVPAAAGRWHIDPWNAAQLRYWDGSTWTHHVFSRSDDIRAYYSDATPDVEGAYRLREETRLTMSSAEWQAHVRGWMVAGAVEQEIWRRLSTARVSDADPLTLKAQRRMAALTPEQGAQQVRRMLDANPSLIDELGVTDFLGFLLRDLGNLGAQDRRMPLETQAEGQSLPQ